MQRGLLRQIEGWFLPVVCGLSLGLASCEETPAELKNRADTGNLEAMVKLADAYLEGGYANEPMPYWPEEALRLYRQAAGQLYPPGMKKYGWCLWHGTGIQPSRWEGLRWVYRGYREEQRDRKKTLSQLETESLAGLPKSQYRLATILRDGQGVDPDPVRALGLFEQAARAGYADSQHCFSQLQRQCAEFQQTKTRAQQGDPSAMVRYAEYLEGVGPVSLKIKPDVRKAGEVLEKSAERSAEGKMALARYLLRQDGSSVERVRKLCFDASRSGYSPAMEFIAGLQGEAKDGSGKDLFTAEESLKICQRMAETGIRSAQVLLAKKYLEGHGTACAPSKAIPWLRRAAMPKEKDPSLVGIFFDGLFGPDRGDSEAQFLLGRCYRDGLGTEKSPQEAIRWFSISAQNGNEEAKAALAAMRMARN